MQRSVVGGLVVPSYTSHVLSEIYWSVTVARKKVAPEGYIIQRRVFILWTTYKGENTILSIVALRTPRHLQPDHQGLVWISSNIFPRIPRSSEEALLQRFRLQEIKFAIPQDRSSCFRLVFDILHSRWADEGGRKWTSTLDEARLEMNVVRLGFEDNQVGWIFTQRWILIVDELLFTDEISFKDEILMKNE